MTRICVLILIGGVYRTGTLSQVWDFFMASLTDSTGKYHATHTPEYLDLFFKLITRNIVGGGHLPTFFVKLMKRRGEVEEMKPNNERMEIKETLTEK